MVLNNVKGFDGPYEAPLKLPTRKVLKSWIDYNGHMNVAYYTMAIDNSIDYFLEEILGIGETHAKTNDQGPFVVQANFNYLNENKWIYQTLGKDVGPSLNYINPEYKGKFGIIAPYSKDFCRTCNRLRITSRGDLRLCLFGNTGISVRHLLQKDDQLNELKDLILKQMQFKKESHYLELGDTGSTKNLSKTGG